MKLTACSKAGFQAANGRFIKLHLDSGAISPPEGPFFTMSISGAGFGRLPGI